jgi:predicted outer membrane protein
MGCILQLEVTSEGIWVMSITFFRTAGTLACMAICTASALAQAPTKPTAAAPARETANQAGQPQRRTANRPVSDADAGNVDQMIAGMLALCNEEEAALGKFASERSKNEDVQGFAKTMAKDHSMMAKELQKWAPQATLMNGEDRTSEIAKAGNDGEVRAFDPLQVHKQIASRSIASMEKSLGAKKGTDFDMAYVGSQCVMHQQMIDKASVLRQYASPQLQPSIDKGIDAAQSHLDRAHQLIETLASAERESQ